MPLLDHFHPPIYPGDPWESFHGFWCAAIAAQLNETLPPRFIGRINIHLGPDVAADVAEFHRPDSVGILGNGTGGGVAVATYAPPAPTHVMIGIFPDDVEVQVLDTRDGARLVAVIELVSPRNKDRDSAREAFVAKCLAYLQRGIGLVVVDVVTSRHGNLHNLLVGMLRQPDEMRLSDEVYLYASAYRPDRRQEQDLIDTWLTPLAVGKPLPTMPLALRGVGCVPLDLDASYTRARQMSRL